MVFSRRQMTGILGSCLIAFPGAAVPASLEIPTGEVLLSVTGAISRDNGGETARFDRAMLEALDWVEVVTYTSFTQGPQTFAGPTLQSLLDAVGAQGATIRATAINDYTVKIPVSDASAHDVILALDKNGTPMRVRDKGPIWVVYPLDEAEAPKKPHDNEMIWQLVQMQIE